MTTQERPRGYNLTSFSPKTESTHSFVAAEAVYDDNDIVISYNVAMLSQEQVTNYIMSCDNFKDKACVSLEAIFVPYATYGEIYRYTTSGIPQMLFPSGNNTAIANTPILSKGICPTAYNKPIDEAIFAGNIYSANVPTGETSAVKDSIRSIGINKDVYFVGNSGEVPHGGYPVAGPIDLEWNPQKVKWQAVSQAEGSKPWGIGFTTGAITSPTSRGTYTLFGTTFGTCRNYDMNLAISTSGNVFVVAVQTSGVPNINCSGVNTCYSGSLYYLPIYIGCP
jgi:hypothetical protein